MVEVWIGKLRGEYLAEATHDGVNYRGFFERIPSWVPNDQRETLMHGWCVKVMFNERDLDRLERVKRGIL